MPPRRHLVARIPTPSGEQDLDLGAAPDPGVDLVIVPGEPDLAALDRLADALCDLLDHPGQE